MTKSADILIQNAAAITFDAQNPQSDTIAITGNKISFVGLAEDAGSFKGQHTRIIDAGGKSVTPGLVDSHVHVFGGSMELSTLQLGDILGAAALKEAICRYGAENPDQKLIFGNGIDYLVFGDDVPITRHQLDEILPERPLLVMAADHHTCWANTKALEMVGLMHGKSLPAGNEIVLDANGVATGELREVAAFEPFMAYTPTQGRATLGFITAGEPDPKPDAQMLESDLAILKSGYDHCAQYGITSLHNMDGNFYQLELMDMLLKRGELKCRTNSPFHLKNFAPVSAIHDAVVMRERYNSDMLWSNRVKIFIDGVLEGRTAMMLEDYSDAPGETGDPVFSAEHFTEAAILADSLGLQITVHAIGDAGVRRVLDGYEAAQKANGVRDSRHRIEHIEVIDPADLPRLAQLGVLASMQPLHAPGTGGFPAEPIVRLLGPERIKMSTPWQSLKDTGAELLFSTDWPVVPVAPMPSIKAAVCREKVAEDMPDQSQSIEDALYAYSAAAAYAEFNEHKKGRLKVGMLADIAVFDSDFATIDPQQLDKVKCVTTICDGVITHQA